MILRLDPGIRLVAATHNPGKARELGELLAERFEVVTAGELGLAEPDEPETTFAGNALIKARSAADASGLIALADNSGLSVAALDGAPGVHSARWAGPSRDFTHAMELVESRLVEVGDDDRSAWFTCALAVAWPSGPVVVFEGRVDGFLTFPPRGKRGFGYDPIFIPHGHTETFGEMRPAAKDVISHRAKAFEILKASLFLNPAPLGVYVHWPYCARICPYCDFNVVRDRGRPGQKAELTRAIIRDLHTHASRIGPRVLTSVFLGGGTPSLMDPGDAAAIIGAARSLWPAIPDLEVTLEANPTDAEMARFGAFAAAGANRLSLGLQSLDDASLRLLGRNHDAATGRRAAECAAATFSRVSVDLIYALPGQGVAAWADELREVVALGCEHVSPYQLTIEPGTAFHRAVGRGTLSPPGEEDTADLYETTQRVLEEAGFEAYEVSNHARGAAARSRHNLIYWRGEDYVGVGPGAHGRLTLDGDRWATLAPRSIDEYIPWAGRGDIAIGSERLSARDAALERLLMGLRTHEGVAMSDLAPLGVDEVEVRALAGLARIADGRLIVSDAGRPVLDRIISELAHGA